MSKKKTKKQNKNKTKQKNVINKIFIIRYKIHGKNVPSFNNMFFPRELEKKYIKFLNNSKLCETDSNKYWFQKNKKKNNEIYSQIKI